MKRKNGVPMKPRFPKAIRVRSGVVYGFGIGIAALLAVALIRGMRPVAGQGAAAAATPVAPIIPAGELPDVLRQMPDGYGDITALVQPSATPEAAPEPTVTPVTTPVIRRRQSPGRHSPIGRRVRHAKRAAADDPAWKAGSSFKTKRAPAASRKRASEGSAAPARSAGVWGASEDVSQASTGRAPQLLAGTMIPISYVTGVNSDLPGRLLAQVRANVYDTVTGEHLLIPQGTKVIGRYGEKIGYAQERVLVIWERLIFPNGSSLDLSEMPGVDLAGRAGAADRVNHHLGRLATGIILGSLIAASAEELVANTAGGFGGRVLAGAGTGIRDASRQITEKNLNRAPTIEITPGLKANIFVVRDLTLRPYGD